MKSSVLICLLVGVSSFQIPSPAKVSSTQLFAENGASSPKKVLVLGGDGFCGWPTSLYLSDQGHDVVIVDNLSRRNIDTELGCDSLTPIQSPEVSTASFFRRFAHASATHHSLDHSITPRSDAAPGRKSPARTSSSSTSTSPRSTTSSCSSSESSSRTPSSTSPSSVRRPTP